MFKRALVISCLAASALAHEHGGDHDHHDYHGHHGKKHHREDHEDTMEDRMEIVEEACEEMYDYCEEEIDADNFVQIFACAERHYSKVSSECRPAAKQNFPALVACSTELAEVCPSLTLEEDGPSWWHATPWHRERRPMREASLRCLHEKESTLSVNCTSGIAAQWAMDAPLLGLEASAEPMSEDLLRMFSGPESHGYAWKVFGHGFMAALFILLCIKLLKKCCRTCVPQERRERMRQYLPSWRPSCRSCSRNSRAALMDADQRQSDMEMSAQREMSVSEIPTAVAVSYSAPSYTGAGAYSS